MEDVKQNPFLNVREAGDFLRLKKRTMDNMRWMGTGPSFRKHVRNGMLSPIDFEAQLKLNPQGV